ncbi:MAG: hypothetical protein LIP03_01375 [Bacteroidales bacterium]|nr:hypothetical protein [Bacteroidales bacterium]
MKKLIYMILAIGVLGFASCSQEEPGNTAVQPLAGQWYVTFDGVDADGNVVWEDPFEMGHVFTLTYNLASNVDNQMFVSDEGNFWEYKVRVACDVNSLTFGNTDFADNEYYDSQVKLYDGKILKGAATTPRGMPADSIVYYVIFDDDPYIDYGYWSAMRVSGYRYTGFVEDN